MKLTKRGLVMMGRKTKREREAISAFLKGIGVPEPKKDVTRIELFFGHR